MNNLLRVSLVALLAMIGMCFSEILPATASAQCDYTPTNWADLKTDMSRVGNVMICLGFSNAQNPVPNDHLTLSSGANITLDLNGQSLVITAESNSAAILISDATLTINATGGGNLIATGGNLAAGIGGGALGHGGTTIINGGEITANGGGFSAGIGGGLGGHAGATTINGGTLYANGGEFGAGIGGGGLGNGGVTTINGGYITATGQNGGAGIGGGSGGAGGTNIISGGWLTANGGNLAAGIGGGSGGAGGTTTINGGYITATGQNGGAGIGGGAFGAGGTTTINAGITTASGGAYAAGIGGGVEGAGASVTLSGGELTASSDSAWGAPIGSGSYPSSAPSSGSLAVLTTFDSPTLTAVLNGMDDSGSGRFGGLGATPTHTTSGATAASVVQTGNAARGDSVTFTFSYAVSFDTAGGSTVSDVLIMYNQMVTPPADPTRLGYTFAGWHSASANGPTFDFNQTISLATTVYATWNQILPAPLSIDVSTGAINVTLTGLQPTTPWTVQVYSTPLTLGSGSVAPSGAFSFSGTVPTGLEAGVHHVEVAAIANNGSTTAQKLWFIIGPNGTILGVYSTETAAKSVWASTAGSSLAATGVNMVAVVPVAVTLLAVGALMLARRRYGNTVS